MVGCFLFVDSGILLSRASLVHFTLQKLEVPKIFRKRLDQTNSYLAMGPSTSLSNFPSTLDYTSGMSLLLFYIKD